MKILKSALLFVTGMTASSLALAHTGHGASDTGFLAGVLHPLTGTDHLLVLLAVGMMAAAIKGRQKLMIPAAFIVLMASGFIVAYAGVQVVSAGAIEGLISVSVVAALILTLAIHSGIRLVASPAFGKTSAWSVTAFAIAHGFAHGLEIPPTISATSFALGFLLTSSAIISTALVVTSMLKNTFKTDKVAN